jgi:hypothetical protein
VDQVNFELGNPQGIARYAIAGSGRHAGKLCTQSSNSLRQTACALSGISASSLPGERTGKVTP